MRDNPFIPKRLNHSVPTGTAAGQGGEKEPNAELQQLPADREEMPKKATHPLPARIAELQAKIVEDSRKLKTLTQQLQKKDGAIQALEADVRGYKKAAGELKKQVQTLMQERIQLKDQSEALRKEAEQYRAQAEQYRAQAELAEQYRQEIWNLVVQAGIVTDCIARQNRDYGKLCKNLYRDIQYVLSSIQTGDDCEELCHDLRKALHKFFWERRREEEQAELPEKSQPPLTWKPDLENDRLGDALQEAVCPDRAFRLLAEKLLVLLETGKVEDLPELLKSCGIGVLFYGDASEDTKDSAFFGVYESGAELPALVGQRFGKEQLYVLARGAHIC